MPWHATPPAFLPLQPGVSAPPSVSQVSPATALMCPSPHALFLQLATPAALPLQLVMSAVGVQLTVQLSLVHSLVMQSVAVVQLAVHACGPTPLPASHCS